MRKIILVGGVLAAGKSTYANILKERFNLTAITKDRLKEILGDNIYVKNYSITSVCSLSGTTTGTGTLTPTASCSLSSSIKARNIFINVTPTLLALSINLAVNSQHYFYIKNFFTYFREVTDASIARASSIIYFNSFFVNMQEFFCIIDKNRNFGNRNLDIGSYFLL